MVVHKMRTAPELLDELPDRTFAIRSISRPSLLASCRRLIPTPSSAVPGRVLDGMLIPAPSVPPPCSLGVFTAGLHKRVYAASGWLAVFRLSGSNSVSPMNDVAAPVPAERWAGRNPVLLVAGPERRRADGRFSGVGKTVRPGGGAQGRGRREECTMPGRKRTRGPREDRGRARAAWDRGQVPPARQGQPQRQFRRDRARGGVSLQRPRESIRVRQP